MSTRVQIAFTVEKGTHDGLVKRAQAMGYKVADFARMLFEAGYSARVSRERAAPATDAELVAAVRAVFCLAGELKPKEIARATGFSADMVDNILRGFAKVAGETRSRAKASEDNGRTTGGAGPVAGEASRAHGPDHAGGTPPPIRRDGVERHAPILPETATEKVGGVASACSALAAVSEIAERRELDVDADKTGVTGGESAAAPFDRAAYVRPDRERTPSSFTPDDLAYLRGVYAAGDTIPDIARAMNCTRSSLDQFIFKNRAQFPYRGQGKRKIAP